MMTVAAKPRIATTPLEKMLQSFPDARQKSNGWWAHDDNPRFDFWESPERNIRIHSHTGRTTDDVLAMGRIPLTRAHLYAKPGQWSQVQQRAPLDLLTLAEYMCLDWQFLRQEGYSDDYTYTYTDGRTTRCVKVGGYYTTEGTESRKHRVRLNLHKEPRYLWNQGTPGEIIPCGLHHLDRARDAGYLVIGEGETDWATMTFHGIPFIGIPGANNHAKLDVSLVTSIPTIYIIEEPDQVKKLQDTGQGFYKNMRHHLRAGGYEGDIFSIRWEEATDYKDPSDLHKSIHRDCKEQAEGPFRQEVHKRFIQAIEAAIEAAIPEGNDAPKPYTPPDWAKIDYETFTVLVASVPHEFLSPIQKIILGQLFRFFRDTEPGEHGWRIEARTMAPAVGLVGKKGEKVYQEHIRYMHETLGILSKQTRALREYMNGEDGEEQVRYNGKATHVRPIPAFYMPRGYCAPTQEQHKSGGPRIASETCEYCGSRHLKHYAHQCIDCGHVMYPPAEDESLPAENVVEFTMREQIPEVPNLGTSVISFLAEDEPLIVDSSLEVVSEPTTLFYDEQPAPRTAEPRTYDGPYPPPNRACFRCGHETWVWTGGSQYLCECQLQRERKAS